MRLEKRRRRWAWTRTLGGVLTAAALGLSACDKPDEVEGTTQDMGAGGRGGDAAPAGDRVAPTFSGLSTVTGVAADTLELTWSAAEDETSGAERINYRVYLAATAGAQDFATPVTSATGVTRLLVTGLRPETRYFVVVRAADEAGNEDENTVELDGTTLGLVPSSAPLAEVGLEGSPRDATYDGGALFLPLGVDGLQLVDLRDPSSPVTYPRLDLGQPVLALAADRVAGVAAALREDGSVSVLDVGRLDAAAALGEPLSLDVPTSLVAVSGRRLALLSETRVDFFEVDVTGARLPAGSLPLPAAPTAATGAPEGFYLGLADGTLLSVAAGLSVGEPEVLATHTLSAPPIRLRAADGLVIAGTGGDTLSLLDFALPMPALVGQVPDARDARFDLAGRTLVVGRGDGVVDTLDLSLPATPRLLTSDRGEAPATWVAALPGTALFGAGPAARVLNSPPFVRARFPAAEVAPRPGTPLDFTLSEPALAEGATVQVVVDDTPVEGRLLLLDGGRRFRFLPRTPFPGGARVVGRLSGVRDVFGGLLPAEVAVETTVGEGEGCVIGPEVCDGLDNDCNGAADENEVCRPARNPRSAFPHTVDGQITGWSEGAAPNHEWADVQPAVGRYTYLYVDFDGTRLHLFNDWHFMGEVVDPSCYNSFDVYTGDDREHWNIRVYGDRALEVYRNEVRVEGPDFEGEAGFGRTPQVPDAEHAAWELSFPALPGNWRVQLHDPGPMFNCAEGELATEPSHIDGALTAGGSTVLADARAVEPEAPRLDTLSPERGPAGTVVFARGAGWPDGPIDVRFTPAEGSPFKTLAEREGADGALFTVPEGPAGRYDLTLVFADGPATGSRPFEITTGCAPRACGEGDCGVVDDGCGGEIDCGACAGARCGATLDCMEACGLAQDCQAECQNALDPASRPALDAAVGCLTVYGCAPGLAGGEGVGAFNGDASGSCELICAPQVEDCMQDGLAPFEGQADCPAVHACASGCGNAACRRACMHDATDDARDAYALLAACARENGCDPQEDCRAFCPAPVDACFGAPPPVGEPVLDPLQPAAGPPGERITVLGRNFPDAPATVVFHQAGVERARFDAAARAGDLVQFIVPDLPAGDYEVLLEFGDSATNSRPFTVRAAVCEPAACAPDACGPMDDGCGGQLDCGPCGGAEPRYGWEPMPFRDHPEGLSGRIACAAFSDFGAGFVAGGSNLQFSDQVYFFEQDLPLVVSTPLPEPLRNAAGAWVGDWPANQSARNAYVFGGESDDGTTRAARVSAPIGSPWVEIGPMPRGRRRHDAVTSRSTVFLLGGSDALGAPVAAIDAYDAASGTWHADVENNLPAGQVLAATAWSDTLFVLHRAGAGVAVYRSTDVGPDLLRFEALAQAPFVEVVDYRITHEGRTPNLIVVDLLGRAWSLDTATGAWAEEPPLSEARMPSCLVTDSWGMVTAMGGYVHAGERALGKAERVGADPGTNCTLEAHCGPNRTCNPANHLCEFLPP